MSFFLLSLSEQGPHNKDSGKVAACGDSTSDRELSFRSAWEKLQLWGPHLRRNCEVNYLSSRRTPGTDPEEPQFQVDSMTMLALDWGLSLPFNTYVLFYAAAEFEHHAVFTCPCSGLTFLCNSSLANSVVLRCVKLEPNAGVWGPLIFLF